MKKALLSIISVATLALGSAQAAVVFGNLGQAETGALSDSSYNVTATRWAAVGFTINPNPGQWYGLQSVKLGLVGTGNIRLSLYSDNSSGFLSVPGALIGSIQDTEVVTDDNNPVLVTFTLDQGTVNGGSFGGANWSQLTPSTNYWLVAERTAGNVQWVANLAETTPTAFTPTSSVLPNTSSGWTHLGNLVSTNSGSTWAVPTGANAPTVQALSISVTAIPEPGTWAAMAIFAGGAAYAGWRRRRQQTA